jgi:hypothetical protein
MLDDELIPVDEEPIAPDDSPLFPLFEAVELGEPRLEEVFGPEEVLGLGDTSVDTDTDKLGDIDGLNEPAVLDDGVVVLDEGTTELENLEEDDEEAERPEALGETVLENPELELPTGPAVLEVVVNEVDGDGDGDDGEDGRAEEPWEAVFVELGLMPLDEGMLLEDPDELAEFGTELEKPEMLEDPERLDAAVLGLLTD